MAMSGVDVDPECKTAYDETLMGHMYRYVTLKIDEGKVRIDKKGALDSTYDEFLVDLKAKDGDEDDCRYAIYDYHYTVNTQGTSEPSARTRVFLVCWCPDTARIKRKMLYSASFDSVKKSFKGITTVIQANGEDDIDQKTIEETLRASART